MKITTYDKLVRDRIPEHLESKGLQATTHIADDAEYAKRLAEKLIEEAKEFAEEPSIEELADVLEVVNAISKYYQFPPLHIKAAKAKKAAERGAFNERIVLETVTE